MIAVAAVVLSTTVGAGWTHQFMATTEAVTYQTTTTVTPAKVQTRVQQVHPVTYSAPIMYSKPVAYRMTPTYSVPMQVQPMLYSAPVVRFPAIRRACAFRMGSGRGNAFSGFG